MINADIQWKDDQPFSNRFDDVYFSREGGPAESKHVFLDNNNLPGRWQHTSSFVIAETGFGSGLNFLLTAMCWLKDKGPKEQLHYISIEKYPLSKADLQRALGHWPELAELANELIEHYPPAINGFHHIPLFDNRVSLTLIFDDVVNALQGLHARVNAWYLDGFAPAKNPDMWTSEVFDSIVKNSSPGTTFSTFTASGDVRRGLQAAGFEVEKVEGYGKKREMLRGTLSKPNLEAKPPPWYALPAPANYHQHAVIIGAGIAGITTAWALARRGWTVDIFEKNTHIAEGGSGNPLGIVMPRFNLSDNNESRFYNSAYFKTLRNLHDLHARHPEFNWQQGGVLQLPHTQRIENQIRTIDCCPELAQAIDANNASAIAGIKLQTSALYFPLAGWLNPVELCERLLSEANSNIHIHLDTSIGSINHSGTSWHINDSNGRQLLTSSSVILANATLANKFPQSCGLPIDSARGQISVIPSTPESSKLRCPICHEGYIIPASNNKHVIGASFLAGDDSTLVREEEDQANLQQQYQYLPGLLEPASASAFSRAGLRATTPDRLPVIGPVFDDAFFSEHYADLHKGKPASRYPQAGYHDGLFINAGHGARGLTSAFLSAEIISSMLCGDPLPIPEKLWQAISPSRFKVRALKAGH